MTILRVARALIIVPFRFVRRAPGRVISALRSGWRPTPRWFLRASIRTALRIALWIVERAPRPPPKLALGFLPVLAIVGLQLRGGGEIPLQLSESIAAGELTIEAPSEIDAGDGFEATVSGLNIEVADGQVVEERSVTLLVDSGYELRQFDAPVDGDAHTFEVPSINGAASGVMTLTAIEGLRTGAANVTIVAGEASDPLELFLGPRTIEATGDAATMAVVLAMDRYGNPVPDGTPVTFTVTRPDLAVASGEAPVEGLISWARINSGTLAGRSKLAVTVDEAGGKELDFLEIAGTPESFSVFTVDPPVRADGRSLIRVRTTQIVDEFGNALPDGIDVFADMTGATGVRRLKSETIKGVAEFAIEAPSRPGEASVVVKASGTASDPLILEFEAMVTEMPVDVVTDLDGMVISVGPVFSTLGAYVPDGTFVEVESEFGPAQYPTFNGEVSITLPLSTEPVELELLGYRRTIRIDRAG